MRVLSVLRPAEGLILAITLVLAGVDTGLAALRGTVLDPHGYGLAVLIASAMMGVGLAYRASGRDARIGDVLVTVGLFTLSSLWIVSLNFLMMPIAHAPIDPLLASLDAALGFRWADAIAFAARHPGFGWLLARVYEATLLQVVLLVVVLGLTGRSRELQRLGLTLTFATLGAVVFWSVFPSLGPSTLSPGPDPADLAAVQPLMGPAWGAQALRTATTGFAYLNPGTMDGMIAFPSVHTVLAIVLVYFLRSLPRLMAASFAVNVLVLPAVLVHGAHHLVDIPAGMLTFVLALAAARGAMRVLDGLAERRSRAATFAA